MNRRTMLIAALAAVLVLVAFFFLAWQPQSVKIEEIEAQIETVRTQQTQARNQIAERQELRANAPEIEADIAAVDAIVPRDAAVPAALRQLQLAADESGVDLLTVSPGRPTSAGVAELSVSVTLTGGYFQIVDFLRRIEDPSITSRAILWNTVSIGAAEYPTLTASLSGTMFANIDAPPAPAAEADAPADGEAAEGGA